MKARTKIYQHTIDGELVEVTQKAPNRKEEAEHQAALFVEIRLQRKKYPTLLFLFSTLNGLRLTPAVLKTAKATGMEEGVLDLWLPLKRTDPDGNTWSGLVIDMKKVRGGVVDADQKAWITFLLKNGYRVYICPGCLDAWRCICCYLDIAGPDHIATELQAQEHLIHLANQG